MRVPLIASFILFTAVGPSAMAAFPTTQPQWLTLPGQEGPGKGKSIVLNAGSNEYGPETGLPLLARILSDKANLDLVGPPTPFKKGMKPADLHGDADPG